MDSKEIWQINRIVYNIRRVNFSEDDVFLLLLVLRRHSSDRGVLREFADFLAHRNKDRGMIFEYVKSVKIKIDQPPPFSSTVTIEPVFSVDQLTEEINEILKASNISLLSAVEMNNVMVCIISLLQCVEIREKDGTYIGQLHVAVSLDEILLVGKFQLTHFPDTEFSFVALSANNNLLKIPQDDNKDWHLFNGVCWAKSNHNEFFINQHETTYLG